ncbi:hypothetical protein FB45DRAFT_825431 [Roridomyces roridus]|uniref:PQ loop repeat protein n=1 Tax=Roridomyces roridus TaxID=1738132 RepID=A0AAD7C7M2_9AGAR|nr:hypothetical protein FB45DRAFT_825431 [Roridomyces roridus]
MNDRCTPQHDWFTASLTLLLCIGLIISYLPQHYRIIHTRTSEGLSPWFLLLGSTSSAAGFLNMMTVQHTQIRCCRVQSLSACLESTAGIVQVGLQWGLFSFIFILYMLYFPEHLKYLPESNPRKGESVRSPLWSRSILLARVTVAHFLLSALTTLIIVLASPSPLDIPPPPSPYPDPSYPDPEALPLSLARWALFLGVSSALLAAVQYIPQIASTYQAKLVGALSIPMMCVQSPGAVAMVLSIALRPGTNWTSWVTYAVAGIMQFTLLSICIAWKMRQRRLGIDDFGVPLEAADGGLSSSYRDEEQQGDLDAASEDGERGVPGLVLEEEDGLDVGAVSKALESALGEAAAGDVREGTEVEVDEETPLLQAQSTAQEVQGKGKARAGWW